MSRILRFFVCLGTLFFASNALAAGYSCSSLPKYLSCQHGYYMTSSQSSTTYNGTPKVGNYCQPCSRMGSNYTCAGGTAAPVQSAGGYTCPTYMKYTSCSVGYYMTSNSTSTAPDGNPKVRNACRPCSVYGANYTCAGGTAAPQAIKINVTCPAGQYLPQGATSCTTCPAGSFCPGQTCNDVSLVTGATSACGLSSCSTSTGALYTNSASGSSSINDCYLTLGDGEMVDVVNMGSQYCNEGYYCNYAGQKIYYDENNEERGLTDSRPTVGGYEACARGSYTADYEATACEPCTNGKTTSGTGSTNCNVTCSNSANVATWVTPTWTPNYVSNLCKIDSCVACTKGTGVASCSASIVNNTCTYTATCASGYKNPTCNGSSCSCELDSVTCSAGQYLPAGATSCATCPKGYKCPSSKTYTVSTTADQGNTPCSGSTEYQDATGQTSCKTPSDGYYKKDNTSQQVCGTGYFCKSGVRTACTTYGTGYTTDTTTASVNTQCYLNVAGGKVRNGTTGTTLNTCGVGKFKRPHQAYYGTSYSCDSCPAAESGWTMGTDTGLTNYTACYETKAATSISNYCSAGQLKKNGTSTTTWGTATVSTAFQAKSGSIVNGQTCTQCIGATWSSGGTATSCSACPSGYTANTTPGKSAETQCQIVVDGGKYIAAAKATTPTNCPMDTYKAEHYVNYGSTSSCTRCPTGYGVTGGYGISESSCYISVDKGKYLGTAKGTTFSTCAAGTYKTAHNVYYGSISSCDACRGRTKYSSAGASSCSTVSSGYYTTGCNSSNNSCTGQSQCTGATYCTSGVQNNCPGSYTANTTAGKTAASQCQISVSKGHYIGTANSSTASSCAAGTYKAAHNVNYGSTSSCSSCPTGYTASAGTAGVEGECYISVGAGKYLGTAKGTTLSTCAAGTFKVAHTVNYGGTSSCGVCGDNLYSDAGAGACTACATANGYKNSGTTAASHAGVASCKATCAAGTYVATAGTACTTVGTGYWGAGGTVSQNTTLGRTQCPANYRNGAAAGSESGCQTSCAAGTYVATAKAACTTVGTGYYRATHNVNYGSTSTRTQCPENYRSGAATGAESSCQTSCAAGTYVATANAACTSVGTGYYRAAHSVNYGSTSTRTQCPANYRNGAAAGSESGCQTSCAAGTYVAAANAACTSVGTGYYRASHNVNYGSTSTRTQCPAGYRDGAAAATENGCTMNVAGGKYLGTAKGTTLSTCVAGTFKVAHTVNYGGTSSCGVCSNNQYSDAGAASCTGCKTANGYTNSGTTAASHAGEASCKATCAAGTYVATAGSACTTVDTGYWGAGGTVSQNTTLGRNQCPEKYRDGAAATQKSDCAVQTTAGKYIAAPEATEQTKCPAKNYCPSKSVKYGETNSPTACPPADATTARTTYPDDYLNPTRLSISNQGWSTGLPAITSCSANYTFTNAAGNFTVESVSYNSTTGKYEVGGGKYYTFVNAGWYLVDKYSETYCNEPTNRMLYHNVAECPANSYCPGYKSIPLCSTGTHNDEMGKYPCRGLGNGYDYSPAKSGENTACYLTTTAGKYVKVEKAAEVACESPYYCPGGVKVNYGSVGGNSSCSSLTGVSVSGGTYTSAAGSSANTACKYTAPNKTITGCKTVTTNTVTYSGTAWPATTYGVTANGGYIISGNNTAAATCSQCSGAVWSAGGTATSCSACPAQTSGWTRNSGTGWTAVTQCNQTKSVGGNCSAGVLKQNATSTTAWGSSTISTPLKANPGSIVNGQKCDQCDAGTYSAGGTATSCNPCANWTYAASTGMSSCTACPALTSGWAKADSTGTGWKSHTNCVQISPTPANCDVGNLKQVAASNGATTWGASTVNSALSSNPGYYIDGTACSACTGATYYGGGTATSCTPCPSIYISNTTAAKSKAEQCTVQTTGGYYIKAAKDSTQTECDGGYYCPSATVAYGSTNTQTACPVPADHKRATIPAEYYTNSIANTYIAMSGRKSAITECQVLNTYNGTRGSLYDYVTYNTTTRKYDVQGSVLWFKANPGYYLTTATGCGTYAYYGVAKECDKNAYCPGKDQVECNSSNQATVQVEKFGLELCSALGNGKYATSDGGAAAKSTAACYLTTSNSKFVAAAGAAEGACTAGGWCPGGVRVNYGSTGGRNTCPTKYPSSAASSNSELDCYVTTAAGKYVATVGAGQVNCAGTGYYCPGGTNVYSGAYGSRLTTGGRTQCPAGYRDLVATASTTKEAQCTMNVAGGKYVKVAKESAASGTCAAGYAKAAHSVTYGNTSSCAACTGTTYAENTGQASCTACPTQSGVTNISYWISTGTHTDANGCYGFYNDVALNNGSAARIQCFWDKTKSQYDTSCGAMKDGLKCNAAYYNAALESSPTNNAAYYTDKASVIAKACTSVGKGYWSPADVYTRTQCPAGYRDGAAGASEAQCTMNVAGGKYVAKANESAASGTCAAGYAKAAHSVTYGNTSSCAACTGATYAASTGQASCTTCPTAKTYASAVKSYGYWNNGKDGDHTISDGCYATMTGTLSNGSLTEHGCYLGTDGDYGNGGGKRCYVHQDNLKCNAGYYASTLSNGYVWNNTRAGLLGNTCVGVGAGYYSAANILTRNQCPTGLTTIGYGAGADEVTDCGRILHFGNDKLYLRSGKKTTPSLNVKIGDTTYYGNMTAGTGKGKLRLKSGTTTYSVHDDSM